MSVVTSARKSTVSFHSTKSRLVRFHTNNFKSLLLKFLNKKSQSAYEELVFGLRDGEIKDADLIELLKETGNCISVLDENFHHFVRAILILKWTRRSEETVKEYHRFLLDLCSAHSYYTKFAIDQLVLNFIQDAEPSEAEDYSPEDVEEEIIFSRVHGAIKMLLHVIPMCEGLLIASIINNFPYVKRGAHDQETYILNITSIIQYRPHLRQDFLSLIINKLVALDVQAPRDEIEEMNHDITENKENNCNVFQMDEDIQENNNGSRLKEMNHPIADVLDACLTVVFKFIYSECHNDGELNWERAKSLYVDLTSVFEQIILPTHGCYHVQFLIFYFISFKKSLAYSFLNLLWRKLINITVAPVIRQASVSYIASLLSRAKFIPMSILMEFLTNMCSWIHGYISNQDTAETNYSCRVHGVFYSTCQALFYLIAFRHRDLVNHNKGLQFLQGLNLAKIVTCRLNPLRVCLPPVVSNFASVTRHYQLVYCYSIIEHNTRNTLPQVYRDSTGAATTSEKIYLDTFFPFDPYVLHRSSKFIESLYREYEAPTPSEDNDMKHEIKPKFKEDDDDFLMEQSSANNSLHFSYGTSPGFLHM